MRAAAARARGPRPTCIAASACSWGTLAQGLCPGCACLGGPELNKALRAAVPGPAETARLSSCWGGLACTPARPPPELPWGLGPGAGLPPRGRLRLCRLPAGCLAEGVRCRLAPGSCEALGLPGLSNLARRAATLDAEPVLTSGGGCGRWWLGELGPGAGACSGGCAPPMAAACCTHQGAVQGCSMPAGQHRRSARVARWQRGARGPSGSSARGETLSPSKAGCT